MIFFILVFTSINFILCLMTVIVLVGIEDKIKGTDNYGDRNVAGSPGTSDSPDSDGLGN